MRHRRDQAEYEFTRRNEEVGQLLKFTAGLRLGDGYFWHTRG